MEVITEESRKRIETHIEMIEKMIVSDKKMFRTSSSKKEKQRLKETIAHLEGRVETLNNCLQKGIWIKTQGVY